MSVSINGRRIDVLLGVESLDIGLKTGLIIPKDLELDPPLLLHWDKVIGTAENKVVRDAVKSLYERKSTVMEIAPWILIRALQDDVTMLVQKDSMFESLQDLQDQGLDWAVCTAKEWVDRVEKGIPAPELHIHAGFTATMQHYVENEEARKEAEQWAGSRVSKIDVFMFNCWEKHARPELDASVERGADFVPGELGGCSAFAGYTPIYTTTAFLCKRTDFPVNSLYVDRFDRFMETVELMQQCKCVAWAVNMHQVLEQLRADVVIHRGGDVKTLGEMFPECYL